MPTDTQSQRETGKKQENNNNKKQWKENAAKKM